MSRSLSLELGRRCHSQEETPSFVNIPKQAQPAVPLLGQREWNLSDKESLRRTRAATLLPPAPKHPILKKGKEGGGKKAATEGFDSNSQLSNTKRF